MAGDVSRNPEAIRFLPNALQVIDGISDALSKVYFVTIPLSALIFIFAFFLKEFKTEKPRAVVQVSNDPE